jgi:small subunit ribosomal protein S19e
MPTPYDVPPSLLIKRLAQHLKNNVDSVKPPEWASYTKTGSHTQRVPSDPDWWYVRCASLLRKVYVNGPIGLEHLRSEYGGRKDRGFKPEHTRKGGGAIVRNALKQLEAAELVSILKGRGRVVAPEGRKLLDLLSTELKKELEKEKPELKKY